MADIAVVFDVGRWIGFGAAIGCCGSWSLFLIVVMMMMTFLIHCRGRKTRGKCQLRVYPGVGVNLFVLYRLEGNAVDSVV